MKHTGALITGILKFFILFLFFINFILMWNIKALIPSFSSLVPL